MPNWVKTRLSFNGDLEAAKKLKELVTSTYEKENYAGEKVLDSSGNVIICTNEFDFNKVIPMPEDLNVTSGSTGEWGMRYIQLKDKQPIVWSDDDKEFMDRMEKEDPKQLKEAIELGQKYLNNLAKYGCKTWYEWRCKYWNTKWGCADPQWDDDTTVWFDTAWSFAAPIVEKLSEMFPTLTIEFAYADEDCGSNTGEGEIKNGDYLRENYPDTGSNEAYELYKELWDCNDFVYDEETDTYKWIDEFDEDEDA